MQYRTLCCVTWLTSYSALVKQCMQVGYRLKYETLKSFPPVPAVLAAISDGQNVKCDLYQHVKRCHTAGFEGAMVEKSD